MPIIFSCPHCGTKSQVADQYAGQSGPCAACGKPVTIPFPGGGAGAAAAAGAGAAVGMSAIIIIAVLALSLVVLVACGGILVALALPAVQSAREAARRTMCSNNLKQISIALLNYQDANGSLPPAYIADKDGKPMHSWRVLLLPYLEQKPLYDQYNFNEPWDSPNNLRVAEMMPQVFQCPTDPTMGRTTDYMVIVGKETPFEGAKACRMTDISDGTSNTIMVVEVKNSGVTWTQPKDIDFAASSFVLNKGPDGDIGSHHASGTVAAMCDGSVRTIPKNTQPADVKAMATKAGGELLPPF